VSAIEVVQAILL